MVTSFSSKSEIGLNCRSIATACRSWAIWRRSTRSTSPIPTRPTWSIRPIRCPAPISAWWPSVDQFGQFHFTKTNAYSGNNGRAAILNNANGANVYYTTGNAGNGGNPQPNGVIVGAGAQIITPSRLPLAQQPDPGQPTPVGSFSITELGTRPTRSARTPISAASRCSTT